MGRQHQRELERARELEPIPVTGNPLTFGAAGTAGTTLTDDLMTPGTFNIAGITFNAGASAFVINPNSPGTNGFTLTGGITDNATNTQTINDSIAVTAVQTLTMAAGSTLVFGGNISGTAGGFTIVGPASGTGAGTVTFGGTNTYTGLLTISGAASATGSLVVNLNGSSTASGVTIATKASQVNINNNGALGTGTLTFNTNAIAYTIDNTSGSPVTTTSSAIAWNGNSSTGITFVGSNALTLAGTVTINSAKTITTSGVATSAPLTLTGAISGAFKLTKAGTGNLILTGTNSSLGSFQTNAGTTIVGNSLALGQAISTVILSGGTIDIRCRRQ